MQRLQWRRWLVLLLRALWILMFVFILAQPFSKNAGGKIDDGLMIIDRSFSTEIDPDFQQNVLALQNHFTSWGSLEYNEQTSTDSLINLLKTIIKNNRDINNVLWVSDAQNNFQNNEILAELNKLETKTYLLPIAKTKANTSILKLSEKVLNEINRKHIEINFDNNFENENFSASVFVNSKRIGKTYANENNFSDYYFSPEDEGDILCFVESSQDDYPQDNRRYLLMADKNNINILYVDEPGESSYTMRALKALNNSKLTKSNPNDLAADDLDKYDIIWLNTLLDPNENLKNRILKFALDHPLIISTPTKMPKINPWENITGKLHLSNMTHGYLKFYDKFNPNREFKLYSYYKTDLIDSDHIWETDSGDPVLLKESANIYILLSPFHFEWNEMGLSPYFLNTLGRFITQSLDAHKLHYEIGDVIPLPNGFNEIISPRGEKFNLKHEFTHTRHPGFYHIKNDDKTWVIAVNFSKEEGYQDIIDTDKSIILEIKNSDPASIEKQILGRNAQILFFLFALLFTILEMILMRKGESSK